MQLEISTSQSDDIVVVRATGEVDRDTADELSTALTGAVARSGPGGTVEVDLSGVSFLDSSGVGALLTGHQSADRSAVEFRVRDPQVTVRRVLEITNVWDLLAGSS